jgi:hypothetical protein
MIFGTIAAVLSLTIQLLQMAVSGHFDVLSIVLALVSLIPGSVFTKLGKLVGSGFRDLGLLARAGDELGQIGHLAELSGALSGAPRLENTLSTLRSVASTIRAEGSAVAQHIEARIIQLESRRLGQQVGTVDTWLRYVNPGYGTIGRRTNCVLTALAVDKTLATGMLHVARPSFVFIKFSAAEKAMGRTFKYAPASWDGERRVWRESIDGIVRSWGNGGRGIINAFRENTGGHMFNVLNLNGVPHVVDGQTGLFAPIMDSAADKLWAGGRFGHFNRMDYMWTNPEVTS